MKDFSRITVAVILLGTAQVASALTIDLRSGNGTVGGADAQISYLEGPANSAFVSAFTAADFASARSGAQAQIINRNGAWIDPSSFGGDTAAQWISNSAGGAGEGSTALFAIDFDVPLAAIASATLDLYWSVDNVLGDATNTGVFLNGVGFAIQGGHFGATFSSLGVDVASALVSGTNTLYLYQVDVGGPAGLLFSATLDVTGRNGNPPPGVPVPNVLALLAIGLLGLRGFVRSKRA